MRHQHRPAIPFLCSALACVTVLVATQQGLGQARGISNALVKMGEYAPDFNLPRLTITNDPNGKPIGIIRPGDTFRLSSFRGKRPVCLIMSSYT